MATPQAVTITETDSTQGALRKVKWAWTCTDLGVVTGSVTTAKFTGVIERFITVPGAAGDAPSDNYDIAINDADGYDVLAGAGANRSTSATQQVLASSLGVCLDSALTLEVTNAGDANKGTVILYVRKV